MTGTIAIRRPAALALPLLALLVAALATTPSAATAAGHGGKQDERHHHKKKLQPPARVRIGRVEMARTPGGRPALLVAIRYPIEALGREMSARVAIHAPGGPTLRRVLTNRLSAGARRKPERRRAFTFVDEIDLKPAFAAALAQTRHEGRRPHASVRADGAIDVDGDGVPDLRSHDTATLTLPTAASASPPAAFSLRRAGRAAKPFCGSIPRIRLAPHQAATVPLPACDRQVDWKVVRQPSEGSAAIVGDALRVTAGPDLTAEEFPLQIGPPVQVTVAAPVEPVVRAIGDSVTAGFGYYSDGSLMSIFDLPECKPSGQFLDDACSSNSLATEDVEEEIPVPYSPDYGLANNVSWAAQWANAHAVTNYANLAVSGSEPGDWAPGGSLFKTTRRVESEDPDYILMTIGANPILANTLFGLDPMGCAVYSDVFGGYQKCVEAAFKEVHLRENLKALYANLVAETSATIYLMKYHLSIPSTALAYTSTQLAEIGALLNEAIAEVAAEVNPRRLQVITPPHFDVGLDLEPVYPADYECGDVFADPVDGPSVQSDPTQVELRILHPVEFCVQESGDEPWVISGDTGIHPSAEGYSHMAARVPAPE